MQLICSDGDVKLTMVRNNFPYSSLPPSHRRVHGASRFATPLL
jgi:hypothetical protein